MAELIMGLISLFLMITACQHSIPQSRSFKTKHLVMTLTEWGPFNLFADLGLVNKPATQSEGYLCLEWNIQTLQNIILF